MQNSHYTQFSIMEIAAYASLFFIAFGAATILPLQSELAVVAMLAIEKPVHHGAQNIANAGNNDYGLPGKFSGC